MDETYYAVKNVLGEYGISGKYNGGPHTWRCERPDVYGECTCIDDLVKDLLTILDPYD